MEGGPFKIDETAESIIQISKQTAAVSFGSAEVASK